jgi:hypothetical protein
MTHPGITHNGLDLIAAVLISSAPLGQYQPNSGGRVGDDETAVAQPDASKSNPIRSLAAFVLTSIGIPSLLIAFGYVINSAQEQFLGIAVNEFDPKLYVQAAGKFVFDLFTFTYLLILEFKVEIIVVLILVSLVVLLTPRAERHWHLAQRSRPWIRPALLLVAIFLSIGKILYFDAPTLTIEQVLFKRLDLPALGLDRGSGNSSSATAKPLAKSRMDQAGDKVLALVACAHDQENKLGCAGSPSDFLDRLESRVVVDFALTLFLPCVALLAFRGKPGLKRRQDHASGWRGALRALVVTLIIFSVFGLLYMYGKTFPSTDFLEGSVIYEQPQGVAAPGKGQGQDQDLETVPGQALPNGRQPRADQPSRAPTAATNGGSDLETMSGQALGGGSAPPDSGAQADGRAPTASTRAIVLSYSGDEYVFIDERNESIWRVPKPRIVRVVLTGVKDVLAYHISMLMTKGGAE